VRTHLTDITIRSLKPNGNQADYFCNQQRGFGVRVSPAGTKSFFTMVGNPRRRVHLGKYPTTSLADARKAARRLYDRKHEEVASTTFLEAFQDYQRLYVELNYKPRTAKETKRLLTKHAAPLHNTAIALITTKNCTDIINTLKKSEANHFFGVLRTFFNWCERNNHIQTSPIGKLQKPHKETSRDRLLSDDEVKLIWQESYSHNLFGATVRLLLLTGQRLTQITSLQRLWIHGTQGTIVFPPYIMKGNQEHVIPVTPIVQKQLELLPKINPSPSPTKTFPSSNTTTYIWGDKPLNVNGQKMDSFRAALPQIPHWTLHDFRRYLSSTCAKMKIRQEVVERLLAHTSGGAISPIAAVYNRHSYFDEIREALEHYEKHLLDIGCKSP
jgi:integrase